MTTQQRFERELPDILADLYPVSAPDYRNDLVRQIASTRQRPAWAFLERWIPMRALELGRAVRPVPWRTIGVVALLLVAIAAVAIIAGSSQRKLPPPFGPAMNGQLVLGEAGDIFLVDRATGAKALVVGGPTQDMEPIFSRDGTQFAFFRMAEGIRSLWVADAAGGEPRSVSTTGLVDFSQVEWSPDGRSILLSHTIEGIPGAAIVSTDGSAPIVVQAGMPAENPIWLPGGQEILFRGLPPTGAGLFAVRADGTGTRRAIVPATGALEWDAQFFGVSPDGTEIAYQWRETESANMRIYVIPATGGTPRPITSIESVRVFWSPDGTWIAFHAGGLTDLYVVRADGTSTERRVAGSGDVRWAPDGKHLLFRPDGQAQQLLLDPLGGPDQAAPWTSVAFPDWQRLAPTP